MGAAKGAGAGRGLVPDDGTTGHPCVPEHLCPCVCLSTCVLLQGEPALLEGVLLGQPVSWPHQPPH